MDIYASEFVYQVCLMSFSSVSVTRFFFHCWPEIKMCNIVIGFSYCSCGWEFERFTDTSAPLPPRPPVTSAPSHIGPNHFGPRHLGPSHFGPTVTSAPSHMGPIFLFWIKPDKTESRFNKRQFKNNCHGLCNLQLEKKKKKKKKKKTRKVENFATYNTIRAATVYDKIIMIVGPRWLRAEVARGRGGSGAEVSEFRLRQCSTSW